MKLLTNDEILEILENAIRDSTPYMIITIKIGLFIDGVIFTRDEIKVLYNETRKSKYDNIENGMIVEIVEFQGIKNSKYWGIKEDKYV